MERQLSGRVDHCVPRWLGHVERMDEEHMAKKMMISDVEGNRCRPMLGWMDGVRTALGERVTSVEQGRLNVLQRKRWVMIVRSKYH